MNNWALCYQWFSWTKKKK